MIKIISNEFHSVTVFSSEVIRTPIPRPRVVAGDATRRPSANLARRARAPSLSPRSRVCFPSPSPSSRARVEPSSSRAIAGRRADHPRHPARFSAPQAARPRPEAPPCLHELGRAPPPAESGVSAAAAIDNHAELHPSSPTTPFRPSSGRFAPPVSFLVPPSCYPTSFPSSSCTAPACLCAAPQAPCYAGPPCPRSGQAAPPAGRRQREEAAPPPKLAVATAWHTCGPKAGEGAWSGLPVRWGPVVSPPLLHFVSIFFYYSAENFENP